jgi:hypothetical protein
LACAEPGGGAAPAARMDEPDDDRLPSPRNYDSTAVPASRMNRALCS